MWVYAKALSKHKVVLALRQKETAKDTYEFVKDAKVRRVRIHLHHTDVVHTRDGLCRAQPCTSSAHLPNSGEDGDECFDNGWVKLGYFHEGWLVDDRLEGSHGCDDESDEALWILRVSAKRLL